MPRGNEQKAAIEAQRLEILHSRQRELRKRLAQETKIKKARNMPGEIALKKSMAIFLKIGVPGISFNDIADRLGETRKTVKDWFKSDPDVQEAYEYALSHLKDSAFELMQTYSLEAVETLVVLMRYGSEKYMFESAVSILDRIGIPKVTRSEVEAEHTRKHEWGDHDALVSEIRQLPPEMQEQAVAAIEQLEGLLMEHSQNNNSSDAETPKPIVGSEDEDDDEEDGED